jgi:uncharacterized membrane protein
VNDDVHEATMSKSKIQHASISIISPLLLYLLFFLSLPPLVVLLVVVLLVLVVVVVVVVCVDGSQVHCCPRLVVCGGLGYPCHQGR